MENRAITLKDWQAPNFEATPERRQDWTEEAVQEGGMWWDAQPGSKSEPLLKLLGCEGPEKLKTNSVKPDIRKFVETISDIQEIATYGTGAEQFKGIVQMYNKILKFVFQDSYFPRQSRQALQYATAMGRGYLWPRFRRPDFGWGQGKFEFAALGPREVLPCQVPQNNDIQGSYIVTIIEPLGIAEAHARYPDAQDDLLPVSKQKYSSNAQVRRLEFWDKWRYGEQQKDWDNRYCEIRHTFIRDLRINRSGKMFPMGEKDTSWYYEVPSVGSLISWTNPINKLAASRTATVADSRVYPQLRMISTNPGMTRPLYDGPAYDNHGMMPAVQYDVDDWPWLAAGYSLLQDVAGIEKAERGFLDLMYRVLKAKMKPIMGYDLSMGIPEERIKRLDVLDEEILSIGVDGDPAKALRSLLPDSVHVNQEDFKMIEVFEKFRQKTLGLNDLGSLEKLKFNLSSETADKLLETLGPVAKGISGNMAVAHGKIAQMMKFSIPQYLTTEDTMSILGPDGVSVQVFDFNPNSLVPSHLPHEDKEKESEVQKPDRMRWMSQNMKVVSVPNSLLNVTQMQDKMMWLNFLQRGLPVSFDTAFKKLGVDNWGDSQGATEFEKWQWEQFKMLEMKAKAAQVAAVEMPHQQEEKPGQGKGGGRPPSGKQPPKLESRGNKTGNPRTVVSQSK